MKESIRRLIRILVKMAEEGVLGEEIRVTRQEYEQLPGEIAVLIQAVADLYEPEDSGLEENLQIQDLFCQLLIVTFREADRIDKNISHALLSSFIKDYPDVAESCLAPQLSYLMESMLGYKEVAKSGNRILVWQQLKSLFLAYNEFINALLGFMIPCLLVTKGNSLSLDIFQQPYANRIEKLNSLTGGEQGAYYLIGRFAEPKIRNAIGHGSIWLDSEAAKVRYIEGRKARREYELDLTEFLAKATSGYYLGRGYFAAISTIIVMIDGTELAKSFLPNHLVRVFNFETEE